MQSHALCAARYSREGELNQSVSANANSIRILSVDDHAVFRQGIAILLATQPDMNLIAEASNGQEAIDLFRMHRPDITLMDLRLPDMSGIDSAVAIRTEFPEARIIVLTTFDSDAEKQRARAAGVSAFMIKGASPRKLMESIRLVHAR